MTRIRRLCSNPFLTQGICKAPHGHPQDSDLIIRSESISVSEKDPAEKSRLYGSIYRVGCRAVMFLRTLNTLLLIMHSMHKTHRSCVEKDSE